MQKETYFTCIKTGKVFPFALNFFNNIESNSSMYSNLIAEGGYNIDGFKSKVPFTKNHISYGEHNTPLMYNKELSNALGLYNFKIKDESFNPFGSHKDRRSNYIINVAIENGVDKIACLTAGNAGYSLSRYCARAGIDYTSLVFPWVSKARIDSLSEWGNVIIIDGNRNAGILRPRGLIDIIKEYDKYEREKERNNIWSVTNGFEPISILSYKELLYEIASENPDYIVLPCGSGDIIVGVWQGIKELGLKTKIIGVGPRLEHPLRIALRYGTDEFTISDYKEISIAEKLTTSFTGVLPILYKIFSEDGNIYCEVSNEEIMKAKDIVNTYGIRCENSAVVVFAIFLGDERPDIDPNAKVIIVSTGKGLEN